MSITVGELISLLGDYDDDLEVRLMEQPGWPFEYSIAGVIARAEIDENDREDEGVDDEGTEANVVFLLEGAQLCYGTKAAWGDR